MVARMEKTHPVRLRLSRARPAIEIDMFTTERDGKIAIWVRADGRELNIWDLPKKAASDAVMKAIASAIERGMTIEHRRLKEFCDKRHVFVTINEATNRTGRT